MKRMMIAGAGALAVMALAGCAETNSWFGSNSSDTTSGTTATVPRGTSGTTMGDATVGTGTDTSGTGMIPPTDGAVATQRRARGAGISDGSGERNRAFYPGTLGGNGLWSNETDAPGAN